MLLKLVNGYWQMRIMMIISKILIFIVVMVVLRVVVDTTSTDMDTLIIGYLVWWRLYDFKGVVYE